MKRIAMGLVLASLAPGLSLAVADEDWLESAQGPGAYVPLATLKLADMTVMPSPQTGLVTRTQILQQSAKLHGAKLHTKAAPRNFRLPSPLAHRSSAVAQPVLRKADPIWNFDSLQTVAEFIRAQRSWVDGKPGLPGTFQVPADTAFANADQEWVVKKGAGLYDSSLATLALIQNGNLDDARSILDIYLSGRYGEMDLRAYPNGNNGGAFKPFSEDAFYFFDFTQKDGKYWLPGDREGWKFWSVKTGNNAWLVLALSRYVAALQEKGYPESDWAPYLDLARKVGNAMLLLQDPDAQGGIRFGPKGVYFAPGDTDPYQDVNTENNLSAYSALSALYRVSGDERYRSGYQSIERWLKDAQIYNKKTGEWQTGMLDANTGTFSMGAAYNAVEQRWELENVTATDSGGTWAISALGPERIDALFGQGTTYRMWNTLRQDMGRTAERDESGQIVAVHHAAAGERLDGFDFSNLFSDQESLISPEWSAGGMFSLYQMTYYYREGAGKGTISDEAQAALETDVGTVREFLSTHASSYAIGPAGLDLNGSRKGSTGFGWLAPAQNVTAMASIYAAFQEDPLAWGRP